jgi:hypothetical protein
MFRGIFSSFATQNYIEQSFEALTGGESPSQHYGHLYLASEYIPSDMGHKIEGKVHHMP